MDIKKMQEILDDIREMNKELYGGIKVRNDYFVDEQRACQGLGRWDTVKFDKDAKYTAIKEEHLKIYTITEYKYIICSFVKDLSLEQIDVYINPSIEITEKLAKEIIKIVSDIAGVDDEKLESE